MTASFGVRLNAALSEAGLPLVDEATAGRFEAYLELLVRWNERMNLTAIRNHDEILRRHFVESIACAWAIPENVLALLDFGSGAGFPGIPIALCRPEMQVALAESQGKKAAFLREAVRVTGISATVHAGRAEAFAPGGFDCVALRAVDKMQEAVEAGFGLVRAGGWLVVMTTAVELDSITGAVLGRVSWQEPVALPGSAGQIIAIGQRGQSAE